MTRSVVLAVCLVLAGCQTTVTFESAELSPIRSTPTRTIHGLLAKPEGPGPFAAVVLLPTCGGLQPHVTEFWPDYLTHLGYVTLVVDSLGARNLRQCTRELARDSWELAPDAYGALAYLATLPFVDKQRVGVMGFSLGASTVNYLAGRNLTTPAGLNYKAAVSLYGGCFGVRPSPAMIPLTIIVGQKDKAQRVLSCTALPRYPSIHVHVLPDAYHGFDRAEITILREDSAGNPMLFSAAATKEAQEITREFFGEHLNK